MRLLVGLLMLVSGPLAAQMTPVERHKDCEHVRAIAVKYELWLAEVCQNNSACSRFQPRVSLSDNLFSCLPEGYSVCEAAGPFDRNQRDSCVTELDELVSEISGRVSVSDLSARMQRLIDQTSGFMQSRLKEGKASLGKEFSIDCEEIRASNLSDLPHDEFCDRVNRIHVAAMLNEMQRFVSRAEQDQ